MRLNLLEAKTLGDTISYALTTAFYDGRKAGHAQAKSPGSSFGYDPAGAMNDLLLAVDKAGFDIVPKGAPPEGVVRIHKSDVGRVETRVREGSPTLGTVAVLTPEGERIIQAVSAGDYSSLSDRDFAALVDLQTRIGWPHLDRVMAKFAEGMLTPEDFTGEAEPEQPAVHPVTEALREKLAEALPGTPVSVHTRRRFTVEDVPTVTVQPVKAPPCPWVLKEVRPCGTEISEVYGVMTFAKAVLVNMISGAEQEIKVEASADYSGISERLQENVELSVREAMGQARTAAEAFIAAMSPAPVTAPGEAA